DVWPWVAQIGAPRRLLQLRLAGERLRPRHPQRRPHRPRVAGAPPRRPGARRRSRPCRLVRDGGPAARRARAPHGRPRHGPPGGTTRLLVRERAGFGSRLTQLLMAPLGLASFVMTRAMLRGVKARAEGRVAAGEAPVGPRSG